MTIELKRWDQDRPEDGAWINLYRTGEKYATFCRAHQDEHWMTVTGNGARGIFPNNEDMWCEVPGPPDWEDNQNRKEAEAIMTKISKQEKVIESLREKGRVLAEKMKEPDE